MTASGEIRFLSESPSPGQQYAEDEPSGVVSQEKLPPAMIQLSSEKKDEFLIWLDEWLQSLIGDQLSKQNDWDEQERAYRAFSDPPKTRPFVGADVTVIPAISMAVDPIHARLDTGIFKQEPVFQLKGLKKTCLPYIQSLSAWVDFYQKHKLKLRQVASPRLLECTKLGTCVFKTVYDREEYKIKTYNDQWEVVDRTQVMFSGPRVFGVSLGDFLFPPNYQFLQDCPVVAERIRTTYGKLKIAEASKKLTNVDEIKTFFMNERTKLEEAREDMAGHKLTRRQLDELVVYEVWCDYDIDDDSLPERLVATYHLSSRTLLQLRHNMYFNQRKPYTLIPYTITNDSLYGIGICEMVLPFQKALTKWHQMATDNAYLANIRMFIVKKQSGIEEVPRLYAGRCFFVDDPKSDFIPFASGDIYPSTLTERQNLFGMVEKRTGVSDYLTGRESPIIGTRATATSTLALIQEGTKRVEEVLENIRLGFSEIIENCIYIWIQFGTDGLDEIVFGDDKIYQDLQAFWKMTSRENVNGAIAVDLSATDAAGNRQAMQQMQLQIIQIMMQYLEKLLMLGQGALQARMQMPELAALMGDVAKAARAMFKDLLTKYDIRNAEDYLPDLEKYINAGQQPMGGTDQGSAAGSPGGPSGVAGLGGLQALGGAFRGPQVPGPALPGIGGQPAANVAAAGAGNGSPGTY